MHDLKTEQFEIQGESIVLNDKLERGRHVATSSWSPPVICNIIRFLTNVRSTAQPVPLRAAWRVLGRLKSIQHIIVQLNTLYPESCLKPSSDADVDCEYKAVRRKQYLERLSSFGWSGHGSHRDEIHIPGLDELVMYMETWKSEWLADSKSRIDSGLITFPDLSTIYSPGMLVVHPISGLGGILLCLKVVSFHFETHKTLFGDEESFHLELEFSASMGDDFTIIKYDEVLSSWTAPIAKKSLDYVPLEEGSLTWQHIKDRGTRYAQFSQGIRLVHCPEGCFQPRESKGRAGRAGKAQSISGRVVLDMVGGINAGKLGLVDGEPYSYALMDSLKAYRAARRLLSAAGNSIDRASSAVTSASAAGGDIGFVMFKSLPSDMICQVWPGVLGFHMQLKVWGFVAAESCRPVIFQERLLHEMSLKPSVKTLIKAFVAQSKSTSFSDVVEGKLGASIVLLHGPPGCGKTLTAEAVAENLKRPLYYVSMGELGTSPAAVEDTLSDILSLCSRWNAIALIDEADTVLEKREVFDIQQNAVVSVLLQLLERHDGTVFLTTNRISKFDPAVLSRVTLSLAYGHLSADERLRVWELLCSASKVEAEGLNLRKLSSLFPMNGRSIKNAIRLALALSSEKQEPLSQALLEEVVSAMQDESIDGDKPSPLQERSTAEPQPLSVMNPVTPGSSASHIHRQVSFTQFLCCWCRSEQQSSA